MTLRNLDQIVAAEQLDDPRADTGSVILGRIIDLLNCNVCMGIGVISADGKEAPMYLFGRYRGRVREGYDHLYALEKEKLQLCECRLRGLEIINAVQLENAKQILMPGNRT